MSRFLLFTLGAACAASLFGQPSSSTLICSTSAVAPIVRSEGISERMGDIVLTCFGGQPGATVTGNLTVFLSVNVTNHETAANVVDAVLTVDNAPSGAAPNPVPANVSPILYRVNAITWNGLSFTLSSSGTVSLRIANLRGNASQVPDRVVSAQISTSFAPIANDSLLLVAAAQTGLYTNFSSRLICGQAGAKLPDTLSFSGLVSAGSYFASARATEGFASAFSSKSDFNGMNADSGTRLLVRYGGFPSGAHLVVPDFIAGSSADVPTAGGDFGLPAAGGTYSPGKHELLLVRVNGADANGAGGTLAGAVPAATTTFDAVSELTLSNGSAYAVYEVVDSSPSTVESVQFPTWLGVAPQVNGDTFPTTQTVTLAPVSNVTIASTSAPVPRFTGAAPTNDCGIIGDCTAAYFPRLSVDTTPLTVTTPSNQNQSKYIGVRNEGSGAMGWSASVNYANGSNWVKLYPTSGINNGTVQVFVTPNGLPSGTYHVSVVVDAGAVSGSRTIPLTVIVTAPQVEPVVPVIQSAAGAAGVNTPIVPGSLASIYGRNLTGKSVQVTFNGTPADILYSGASQINVRVPADLSIPAGAAQTPIVVTVDSVPSAAFGVVPVAMSPAIFDGGVLNQDNTPNSAASPAATGSVLQVFATGFDPNGTITAKVHDRDIAVPQFAGQAPGFPGLYQVNVQVPSDLPTMQTYLYVCGSTFGRRGCSPAQKLWIVHP